MNGVLVVDKPAGITSHDVVAKVRRLAGERSVGHLGTLDPMATGVLPLVLGRMTRLAQFYTGADKRYEGEIRLGFATDTYDAEGEPLSPPVNVQVTLEQARTVAQGFQGALEQLPPPFSAKKIAGVPAYKLARKKREVPLQPVQVTVHEFVIERVEADRIFFRAHVSAGTYLRSIAHELGVELGAGGHLARLRRSVVGEFTLEDARTLEQIAEAAQQGRLPELFVHLRRVLTALPSVTASGEAAAHLRNGRAVNLPELSRAPLVKVFCGQNELIAIASRIAGTLFRPKVVFPAG